MIYKDSLGRLHQFPINLPILVHLRPHIAHNNRSCHIHDIFLSQNFSLTPKTFLIPCNLLPVFMSLPFSSQSSLSHNNINFSSSAYVKQNSHNNMTRKSLKNLLKKVYLSWKKSIPFFLAILIVSDSREFWGRRSDLPGTERQ